MLTNLFKRIFARDELSTCYQDMCRNSSSLASEFVPFIKKELARDQVERVKHLAFYLPQFHPIPENDEWWGKNFTEWNSVVKAVPQFFGHHQPQLPVDTGFYNLLDKGVWEQQLEIAKNYGLFGFCFYFYWFNGRRVLEKPLELFLDNPDLDFPFCYFWANDSWVRTWHGFSDFEQGDRVLLDQKHNDADDINVMTYLCRRVFSDRRYILLNRKPLMIVYHTHLFPDIKKTTAVWRQIARDHGFDDLALFYVMMPGQENSNPIEQGFDGMIQFSPIGMKKVKADVQVLNPNFKGEIYSYLDAIAGEINREFCNATVIRNCFMAWDNEARRPEKGISYTGSSPRLFSEYLSNMDNYALSHKVEGESLVFINAWNEWAEGAHLEPDRRFGYAWLDVLAKVIAQK